MTFESMIDTVDTNAATANANANTNLVDVVDVVAVKVSFGDEMRRASFNGGAYVALHELVAKMFELDQASFVLKYQDEDGDKITVSSDGEVKDALQLAKEKKLLRLFVELKSQVPKVDETAPLPAHEFPCGQMFGARFGRHPGHGPHHGPHHGGPHHGGPHGPHQGPHGPHRGFHGHGFRGGFGGFGFGGRGGFGMRGGFAPHHGHGRFGPASPVAPFATETPVANNAVPQTGDPNANFHTPSMFAHGSFSPAEGPFPRDINGPYAARCALKEHRHAMKEHIKLMKTNAATPEDLEAIKEFKEQMKSECKARWHAVKEAKKEAKKDRKGEKKCEKKWEKKWEKGDKKSFAKHVADVTIPDNSELPANTPVTKTWRIRNEGHVAWPADSQLIFVSRKGDNLNGPERVFVGTVEPQQEVDVSVTFLTPSEPGRYMGFYRMANSAGEKFGQRVWVAFIVPNVATAVASEAETKTDTPSAPAADVTMD